MRILKSTNLMIVGMAVLFAVGILVSPSYARIDPEGLGLYLSFDEGSGDVARDNSGNGNDGKIEGGEWVEGKIVGALEFDGVSSGVTVERSDSIEPSEAISITTWLEVNNSIGNHEIVRKQTPNGKGYDIRIENGTLRWWVNTGAWANAGHPEPLPDGEWVFLACTYDGSIARIYVDGEEVASNNISGDITYDGDVLLLGTAVPHDTNFKLNGALDEFAIFSRTLSATEVKEIMISGIVSAVSPQWSLVTTWGDLKQ